MQNISDLFQHGQLVCFTSLTTDKCIQLTSQSKQINALGKKDKEESNWEIISQDNSIFRLKHDKEKLFIHLNKDHQVDVTSKPDVSCDIKILSHSIQSCISLKFNSSPNCFLGFNQNGQVKETTKSSREDIFSFSVYSPVKENQENQLITITPEPNNAHMLKQVLLNIYPKSSVIPRKFITNQNLDEFCFKRAHDYNEFFAKQNCDVKVNYFGKLIVSVGSADLTISKADRKVYFYIRSKLPCFGDHPYDEIRVDALGKYPCIKFASQSYEIPIFQAFGEMIGRQLTDLDIDVFRNRPTWIDRRESHGFLHLATRVKETDIFLSFDEEIQLKSQSMPKGFLYLNFRFAKI